MSIEGLFDHTAEVWFSSESRTHGAVVQTWLPVEQPDSMPTLNCAVVPPRLDVENIGPGETTRRRVEVYFAAGTNIREGDVVRLTAGPQSPSTWFVLSVADVRGHHLEVGVEPWAGTLPGEGFPVDRPTNVDPTPPAEGDALVWDGSLWVPTQVVTQTQVSSLAIAWTQLTGIPAVFPGAAQSLNPGAQINGVLFNGTANITIPAAAGTLTGTTLAATVVQSSLTSVGVLTSLDVAGVARFGAATAVAGSTFEINKATGSAAPSQLIFRLRSTTDAGDWSTTIPPLLIDFWLDDTTSGIGSRAQIGMIPQFATGSAGQLGFWVGTAADQVLAMRLTRSGTGTSTITFLGAPTADISSAGGDAGLVVRNTSNGNDVTSTASLRLRPDTRGTAGNQGGVTMIKENADWSVLNNRDAALAFFVLVNDVRTEAGRFRSDGQLDIQNNLLRAGVQLLSARKTGWSLPTGTRSRAAFDPATVTLEQGMQRLAALIDDMHATSTVPGHGLIGA